MGGEMYCTCPIRTSNPSILFYLSSFLFIECRVLFSASIYRAFIGDARIKIFQSGSSWKYHLCYDLSHQQFGSLNNRFRICETGEAVNCIFASVWEPMISLKVNSSLRFQQTTALFVLLLF